MTQLNLAAFTPPVHPYPPYASANFITTDVGEAVELTVRGPARGCDGHCGDSATISFTAEEFKDFVEAAASRLELTLQFQQVVGPFWKGAPLWEQVQDALKRRLDNGWMCDDLDDMAIAEDMLTYDADLEGCPLLRMVEAVNKARAALK